MPPTLADRLRHILTSIEDIRLMLSDRTLAEFASDRILLMAVERSFEIMSEASRYIPSDLKEAETDIDWQKLADLGNRLRHAYYTGSTRSFYGTSPRTTWLCSSVLSNASSPATIRPEQGDDHLRRRQRRIGDMNALLQGGKRRLRRTICYRVASRIPTPIIGNAISSFEVAGTPFARKPPEAHLCCRAPIDLRQQLFDQPRSGLGPGEFEGRLAVKNWQAFAKPPVGFLNVAEHILRPRLNAGEPDDAFGFLDRKHLAMSPRAWRNDESLDLPL
jgi:uncharacterized protein with HEPN domain